MKQQFLLWEEKYIGERHTYTSQWQCATEFCGKCETVSRHQGAFRLDRSIPAPHAPFCAKFHTMFQYQNNERLTLILKRNTKTKQKI